MKKTAWKQNRTKRKFFLDLNFDKDEQTSFAETERKRENIFIKNSIDKPQIIRVNQNKTMNINSNNIRNILRKEKIIENKYPINNNDGPNIHNSEIKQIITDLKEDKNNTNIKKKVNMKRYNSIRKIMNNLYYNSYLTDKKNCDNKEKTLKKEKSKKLNLNNNNNHIFKDSENIMLVQRRDFKSKDVDKFTVVIWVEGDDPDCIDDLLGGEMKMHMTITEEHIKQE